MTTTIEIYGASDDLIQINGAIVDEHPAHQEATYVYASTGDIVRFRYEIEGWRATVVHLATKPYVEKSADAWGGDHVFIDNVAWVVVTGSEPVFAEEAGRG